MGLSVTVWPQFTSVTDRQTDGRTTDCILRRRRQQLCEQLVKHATPQLMDSATLSADALSVAVIDMY